MYRHNPTSKLYHDLDNLQERCNTDDMTEYVDKPGIIDGFDGCRWCVPGRELVIVDPDGRVAFAVTDSTNVREIVFTPADEEQGELLVSFTSGSQYRYERVPQDVFYRLNNAKSVGQTFDRLVRRGGYTFTRILDTGHDAAVLPPEPSSEPVSEQEGESGHEHADAATDGADRAPGGPGEGMEDAATEAGAGEHDPAGDVHAGILNEGAGADGGGARRATPRRNASS